VKLVVGLGNPGRRYAATRHNVGYRVVEAFASGHGIVLSSRKFSGRFGRGRVGRCDVALLEPETFMNLSGAAVAEAVRLLPMQDLSTDLLVVSDDVDLPFGRLRLRPGGGAGGHKGLRDIIEHLGQEEFSRLRFGVGRPPHPSQDTADWVLEAFGPEEEKTLPQRIEDAVQAISTFLESGIQAAMNQWNREASGTAPREE
jgi:PTH1 family peptidyl-tRNA hydrolase